MEKKKKYVVLRGIAKGNQFYTTNAGDVTRLADGTTAYVALAYFDTIEECQKFLYGRTYTI